MKRSLLALISLLVLPLVSSPQSSSLSAATDVETRQSTDSLIAFVGYRYEDDEVKVGLFTVNSNGRDRRELTSTLDIAPKNLTHQQDYYSRLSWLPGGERIASITDGSKLVLINTDGSGLVDITSQFPTSFSNAVWSSTGEQVAFVVPERKPLVNGEGFSLYVTNQDGSELTELTDDRDLGIYHPVWQP